MQKNQFHPTIAIAITVAALMLLTPSLGTGQPTWHQASFSLPSAMSGGNMRAEYVPNKNSIYIFGGYVDPTGFTIDIVKIDLGLEVVTVLPVSLPFSTQLHAVQSAYNEQDGKIYIFHVTDVYQFDPSAETFVNLGVTLPESVGDYAIAKYVPSEDAIYVFGNRGSGGGNWTLRFEPSTLDVQQPSATMQPSNNTSPSAAYCAASEYVYLFGGNWSSFSFDLIQEFDPSAGTFTTLPITLPTIAGSPVAEAVLDEDAIYIFGGYDNSTNVRDVSKFDCLTGTLLQLPDLPIALNLAGAAYIPNERRIYIFGGVTARRGGYAPATNAIHYLQLDQLNQPPVALCKNVMVNADANCKGDASTDDGSFDPDGDPITLAQDPPGPYPLGSTEVTLTVTDDKGASAQCTATVTVEDVTAPTLSVSSTPITLWPPNHKYATIDITQYVTIVSENCANLSASDVVITDVDSDEPEDAKGGGDGKTEDDIIITSCNTVDLRAERQGSGNGRVYTIHLELDDGNGNTTTALLAVHVPKNQNGDPAVDDGAAAGFTISGDCGTVAKFARSVEEVVQDRILPDGYELMQNYPNPFNPSTTITFAIPETGEVALSIYNLRGQLIQTLHSGPISAGQHSVVWSGTDFRGAKVASGVYLYKLQAKNFAATRKLVFTK